jgi:hypothetical protein
MFLAKIFLTTPPLPVAVQKCLLCAPLMPSVPQVALPGGIAMLFTHKYNVVNKLLI